VQHEKWIQLAPTAAVLVMMGIFGGCHRKPTPVATAADVAAAQQEAQHEVEQAQIEARKDVKSAAKVMGVESIRHRGDAVQAGRLERWLGRITKDYADAVLPFDEDGAQVWGRLPAPNRENPLDKQIAATALICDLIVVTRNTAHYAPTGVRLLNPFT